MITLKNAIVRCAFVIEDIVYPAHLRTRSKYSNGIQTFYVDNQTTNFGNWVQQSEWQRLDYFVVYKSFPFTSQGRGRLITVALVP